MMALTSVEWTIVEEEENLFVNTRITDHVYFGLNKKNVVFIVFFFSAFSSFSSFRFVMLQTSTLIYFCFIELFARNQCLLSIFDGLSQINIYLNYRIFFIDIDLGFDRDDTKSIPLSLAKKKNYSMQKKNVSINSSNYA